MLASRIFHFSFSRKKQNTTFCSMNLVKKKLEL